MNQPRRHFVVAAGGQQQAPGPAAVAPGKWDHNRWLDRFAAGQSDWNTQKKSREKVAQHNYSYFVQGLRLPIPTTIRINWNDAAYQQRIQDFLKTVNASSSSRTTQRASGVADSFQPRSSNKISFMVATTDVAAQYFTKQQHKRVVALNYANGFHPGGGYVRGSRAQEEDLCRQFPTYFSSLNRAYTGRQQDHRDSLYPFGPGTAKFANPMQKKAATGTDQYADILFTDNVPCLRAGESEGYRVYADEEKFSCAFVAAAAPNLRQGELFDELLLKHAMTNIICGPQLFFTNNGSGVSAKTTTQDGGPLIASQVLLPGQQQQDHHQHPNGRSAGSVSSTGGGGMISPGNYVIDTSGVQVVAPPLQEMSHGKRPSQPTSRASSKGNAANPPAPYDVLILGAWGCGAFGCDAQQMVSLFAQVILELNLDKLYEEICFAVPDFPNNSREQGAVVEKNHVVCQKVLKKMFGERLESYIQV
ncbi:unnamed protein product [Amoebophrya sp. A120]|nr:unnamed protein product [Amoebophrya sp. A120]|eukprot:GSA120T00009423001.1